MGWNDDEAGLNCAGLHHPGRRNCTGVHHQPDSGEEGQHPGTSVAEKSRVAIRADLRFTGSCATDGQLWRGL